MRLSDYVARRIADAGVTQVFMITGGGAMHLNDSFAYEPRLHCVFNHHEQACAMAAEGYARVTNRPALVNVTTGPGGINALTGVHGAWTDSIPMLVVSGQVKRETLTASYDLPHLRQLGDQEVDIVSMARGVTKYAALLMDPRQVRHCLEKAIYLCTHGRPGPCWLDIPIDVQAAQIEPADLDAYVPARDEAQISAEDLSQRCAEILRRFRQASRPVIMVGTGVRLAGAEAICERVTKRLGVPVVPAWTAVDLVPSDDPHFAGRAGTIGDRAGNFTVQNSDLLLVVGSRLNLRQISYNWKSFARAAFKIQVDVDPHELAKPTVRPDLGICCDARVFFEEVDRQLEAGGSGGDHADWLAWCRARVEKYPVVESRHRVARDGRINPYLFVEQLFDHLETDDVVVCANATASVVGFQAGRIRKGMRVFANSGCATMGYDLPAAVGAAMARSGKRVICLAGDGSIQLNVQELQTVAHHRLPLKVFVLSNNGYLSMRLSQGSFFGRFVGESPQSGISFPSMTALAHAYGIPASRASAADMEDVLAAVLRRPGPELCEVELDSVQPFEPKLSSRQLPDGRIVSSPLEDLSPFLSRDELLQNLRIPAVDHD